MYGRDGKSPRPVGRGVGHYRREVTRTAVMYRVSKVDSSMCMSTSYSRIMTKSSLHKPKNDLLLSPAFNL